MCFLTLLFDRLSKQLHASHDAVCRIDITSCMYLQIMVQIFQRLFVKSISTSIGNPISAATCQRWSNDCMVQLYWISSSSRSILSCPVVFCTVLSHLVSSRLISASQDVWLCNKSIFNQSTQERYDNVCLVQLNSCVKTINHLVDNVRHRCVDYHLFSAAKFNKLTLLCNTCCLAYKWQTYSRRRMRFAIQANPRQQSGLELATNAM